MNMQERTIDNEPLLSLYELAARRCVGSEKPRDKWQVILNAMDRIAMVSPAGKELLNDFWMNDYGKFIGNELEFNAALREFDVARFILTVLREAVQDVSPNTDTLRFENDVDDLNPALDRFIGFVNAVAEPDYRLSYAIDWGYTDPETGNHIQLSNLLYQYHRKDSLKNIVDQDRSFHSIQRELLNAIDSGRRLGDVTRAKTIFERRGVRWCEFLSLLDMDHLEHHESFPKYYYLMTRHDFGLSSGVLTGEDITMLTEPLGLDWVDLCLIHSPERSITYKLNDTVTLEIPY